MMQLWIKIILIIFCGYNFIRLFTKRKELTGPAELLFWGMIWGGGIILIAYPSIISGITFALQIGRPVDLIIYITIPLLFFINYRSLKKIDKMEHQITEIVRNIAIEKAEEKYGKRK